MVIAAVAVGAGVVGWGWLNFRNTTTPVSISDLIEGFDEIAGTTLAVEGLAEPGVYEYTTSGSERIDVLTKPERTYPPASAVIVRPQGCGMRVEWRPVEERVEWWEMCVVDGGIALSRYGGVHEFFGTRDERTVECSGGTWLLPPADAEPVTVSTCTGGAMVHERTVTVVGPATVDVGGERVRGIEVRIDIITSGNATGKGTTTLVLSPRGMPLSWAEDSIGRSASPIGDVTQTETFRLTQVSLRPAG